MSISDVLSAMTTVYETILTMFGSIVTTITGNPLLFVPVLFALFGGVAMFALGIVKRLGVRGVSSAGRRRRR